MLFEKDANQLVIVTGNLSTQAVKVASSRHFAPKTVENCKRKQKSESIYRHVKTIAILIPLSNFLSLISFDTMGRLK
jgi:hypothetical protein